MRPMRFSVPLVRTPPLRRRRLVDAPFLRIKWLRPRPSCISLPVELTLNRFTTALRAFSLGIYGSLHSEAGLRPGLDRTSIVPGLRDERDAGDERTSNADRYGLTTGRPCQPARRQCLRGSHGT